MVRLRLHPPAQHELPAHRPLPDVPFHLHGGPDGEHAGRLGQLAPKAFLQCGPLLHYQREPVGPDGDCDPSFLHDGGDHGPGLAVGSLPLQGHPPHLRDQLLQQLLLPGLHDPRTLFLTVKTVIVKLLPCGRPEAFLVPAAVIITCNVLIARTANRATDVQNRRDVWLVHVYSLVFVMCWLPYHLVMFLMIIDDLEPYVFSCNTVEVLYFSFSVVQTISLLHCVANPFLYNFLSKSFRNNLINTMLNYIPREGTAEQVGPRANAKTVNEGGTDPGKRSNASTSHSDVGS
ncbi:G-protein coupled receptor 182 isoform X2 [Pundamilia nyererei]|uniref:G-protein coupled receptor 182 isoform X2 n=1 Tax=Pundamilia nyererei TaxID=303518 RepID=A0A9Y3RPR3_9CICH|nr:PREDICTED: G-protein coupled receptor 182 isoform X2 [Pundamilia nyererei]